MPKTNGKPPVGQAMLAVAAMHKADKIIQLLENLKGQDTPHLATGSAQTPQKLENWPIPGHFRYVTPYRGNGGLIAATAGVFQDVAEGDPGRMGLSLINSGANPAFVYGARAGDAENGGVPTGYVGPNGGAWDGRISGELWCGPVSIQSALGTTLVLWVI